MVLSRRKLFFALTAATSAWGAIVKGQFGEPCE